MRKEEQMDHLNVPWASWVVVCDGAKALILQNVGDAKNLNLQVRQAFEHRDEADRDIGTDKPGRSHKPGGVGGSTVEETSWHEQAEDDFLKEVAAKIDGLVHDEGSRRIVLVAPPKALGTLRQSLSTDAQAAITAQVAKDLTNIPVDQIEQHLAA
jgi:protein required for attachment to host cells